MNYGDDTGADFFQVHAEGGEDVDLELNSFAVENPMARQGSSGSVSNPITGRESEGSQGEKIAKRLDEIKKERREAKNNKEKIRR